MCRYLEKSERRAIDHRSGSAQTLQDTVAPYSAIHSFDYSRALGHAPCTPCVLLPLRDISHTAQVASGKLEMLPQTAPNSLLIPFGSQGPVWVESLERLSEFVGIVGNHPIDPNVKEVL